MGTRQYFFPRPRGDGMNSATDTPMTEIWAFVWCADCERRPLTASSGCPMQTGVLGSDEQGCWQRKRVPFSGIAFSGVREDEVRE